MIDTSLAVALLGMGLIGYILGYLLAFHKVKSVN